MGEPAGEGRSITVANSCVLSIRKAEGFGWKSASSAEAKRPRVLRRSLVCHLLLTHSPCFISTGCQVISYWAHLSDSVSGNLELEMR
jgi:hypothetical protein